MKPTAELKDEALHILPVMSIFILSGVVLLLIHLVLHGETVAPFWRIALDLGRELGMGLIVAGGVGLVFESLAHSRLIGRALHRITTDLSEAESKQSNLLDALEERVNRVGDEIVMTSGMLRNATKVGIEAVYNGREEEWHRDVARAIADARGPVKIAGISLADVCGYWGGRSALHEEIEKRMASPDEDDTLQILFSDPEGEGLRLRAKFEHPGISYDETRAYKQTVAKIRETLEIARSAIQSGKIEVKLYGDTPMCFLIITEEHLFVEHYHYAGRGGQNVMLAIKGKTSLFRTYEDHFDAMWRDAKSANQSYIVSNIMPAPNTGLPKRMPDGTA